MLFITSNLNLSIIYNNSKVTNDNKCLHHNPQKLWIQVETTYIPYHQNCTMLHDHCLPIMMVRSLHYFCIIHIVSNQNILIKSSIKTTSTKHTLIDHSHCFVNSCTMVLSRKHQQNLPTQEQKLLSFLRMWWKVDKKIRWIDFLSLSVRFQFHQTSNSKYK